MRISIISSSCCNPAMKSEDQAYLTKVREALTQSKVEARVSIVTMTEALSSFGADKVKGIRPLWDKHGVAIFPAMYIDDELVLYGGVPTKEKIIEAIVRHGRTGQQDRIKPDNDGNPHPENEKGA